MTSIPKPKHCGQNWLEMNPTNGGRICRQCDKIIVDFSNKSWAEIENIQRQNNNGVCGMYKPQQLDYWGQEIPTNNHSFLKAVAITGLTVSFATSLHGQKIDILDSIVIEGKIIDETTSEELLFASVHLKNCKIKTLTDHEGNFKLVLRNIPRIPMPDTLEINSIGYQKKQIAINDVNKIKVDSGKLNLTLAPETKNITAFYVRKPTLVQRIKWKLNKWFRRK